MRCHTRETQVVGGEGWLSCGQPCVRHLLWQRSVHNADLARVIMGREGSHVEWLPGSLLASSLVCRCAMATTTHPTMVPRTNLGLAEFTPEQVLGAIPIAARCDAPVGKLCQPHA